MKVLLFVFLFVCTRVEHIHLFTLPLYRLNDCEDICFIQTTAQKQPVIGSTQEGRYSCQVDTIERVGTYDLHCISSQSPNLVPLCFADDRFSICHRLRLSQGGRLSTFLAYFRPGTRR